jgi:hypothetical protein
LLPTLPGALAGKRKLSREKKHAQTKQQNSHGESPRRKRDKYLPRTTKELRISINTK